MRCAARAPAQVAHGRPALHAAPQAGGGLGHGRLGGGAEDGGRAHLRHRVDDLVHALKLILLDAYRRNGEVGLPQEAKAFIAARREVLL